MQTDEVDIRILGDLINLLCSQKKIDKWMSLPVDKLPVYSATLKKLWIIVEQRFNRGKS